MSCALRLKRPKRLALALAVVAVSAFSLTALVKARNASTLAACISHLRANAIGWRNYEADDSEGWGIPAHPGHVDPGASDATYVSVCEWGGKSGVGRPDLPGDGNRPQPEDCPP